MDVLVACVSVSCVWCSPRPEEGIEFHKTRVTDSCEPQMAMRIESGSARRAVSVLHG